DKRGVVPLSGFLEDIDRKIARLVRRDGPDVPRLPVSFVMSLVQIVDLSPAESGRDETICAGYFCLGSCSWRPHPWPPLKKKRKAPPVEKSTGGKWTSFPLPMELRARP